MKLSQLEIGQSGLVSDINADDATIIAKLREIGFAEGDEVEILHFGPLGRTPICVRLNRTMVALRPNEAQAIMVAPL